MAWLWGKRRVKRSEQSGGQVILPEYSPTWSIVSVSQTLCENSHENVCRGLLIKPALACLCPAGTAPSPAGPTLRVAVCCWAGLTRGEWIKINLNLMVEIPKWSFKSIWRGKSYFLRPFMALNCLSSSPSPFHWPTSRRPGVPPAAPRLRLDCLCDLRGSLLWVHLARLGADWAVLLQIQCLNIPKEWNLPAVQPVRWLLNTTLEDQKHKNPSW